MGEIMFNAEEIALMNSMGLNGDFNNLSEEDDYWVEIEEKVGEYLTLQCLDENYSPNEKGTICEAILDKIPV